MAACTVVLLISVITPLFLTGHDKVVRVHQHRQDIPQYECTETDDGGLCTYLPIVEINTGETQIPGCPVSNNDGTLSYTTAADGATVISADMNIIGTDTGEYHHANGKSDISSRINIRIRGNSSRYFDKPSYAIRLVDNEGNNNPQLVMGMDAHHEWVLYGP